jgi:hypothetical protein
MTDRRRFFSSFGAAQAPAPLAPGAFLFVGGEMAPGTMLFEIDEADLLSRPQAVGLLGAGYAQGFRYLPPAAHRLHRQLSVSLPMVAGQDNHEDKGSFENRLLIYAAAVLLFFTLVVETCTS